MRFARGRIFATVSVVLLTAVALQWASLVRAAEKPLTEDEQRKNDYMVDNGLIWLAAHQKPDGSWESQAPVAATSLSVMAFMARGHTPGQGPYGDNILRGIDYVLSVQERSGLISRITHSMYEHGISTVMLCEAYGMLDDARQEKARVAIGRAVRLILDAQRISKNFEDQGGWRYEPTSSDSDISVTGWQLMALRGAAKAGADVPKSAIDNGITYIKRRAVFGGGFSYTGQQNPNSARTGTGILALELMGQHNSKEALAGGDFLIARPRGQRFTEAHFYAVYYCSQAAWQLGGRYWDEVGTDIRETLKTEQRADGSWSATGSLDSQGGETYATAMSILALTVPYRYLPIYQR